MQRALIVTLLCLSQAALWHPMPSLAVTAPDTKFEFRLPHPASYTILDTNANVRAQWLAANRQGAGTNVIEFGSRVVLQLRSPADLKRLTAGHSLELARTVAPGVFILQATDAWTAAREAHRLAALPEVLASYPVVRQPAALHGPYAAQPTDTFFWYQWNLEQRNADGSTAGADLNVRAAWPFTLGQGITVAIADSGIEMAHPELADRVVGAPHFNFYSQTTNAGPIDTSSTAAHGTEVAGLVAASLDQARMVGVAPEASLASWVILQPSFTLVSDEQLMDMYQYQSNVVSVQNHSWGHVGSTLGPVTLLEQIGISNAIASGRSGRGVIMVRSAGNDRATGANVDDDGYPSDPRVIAVAAIRPDGRATSYSEPGAAVLVAAPSGDPPAGIDGLFTTDLLGTAGVNQFGFFPPNQDLNGYVFNTLSFSGTSASTPQISGIAALLLSANTNLTWRDVQQILILSSRHYDFTDPDVVTNGAGFIVSHNVGFGVPDAGAAVSLARSWSNRPPALGVSFTNSSPAAVPDNGLRLLVTGANVPPELASIQCLPSVGPHADNPTPALPLTDFGYGTNLAGYNLTNHGALIQRGAAPFANIISLAAQAGAAFALVYNYPSNATDLSSGDQLLPMGATDFVPIPAVFIGHTDGTNLAALIQTDPTAQARISLTSTSYVFSVTNTLICEHVGLRLQAAAEVRGDLRITLVSPAGTRSVLQRYNADTNAGPADWTYYSTHHFFESTAGTWTAYFSDEGAGSTATVQQVTLQLSGVPILDTDRDGLDDNWELAFFGSLAQGPRDDPDRDGAPNAREQLMGSNPAQPNHLPFAVDFSPWNGSLARISWSASPLYHYQVFSGATPSSLVLLTNVAGHFPETELFVPYATNRAGFYRVQAVANP